MTQNWTLKWMNEPHPYPGSGVPFDVFSLLCRPFFPCCEVTMKWFFFHFERRLNDIELLFHSERYEFCRNLHIKLLRNPREWLNRKGMFLVPTKFLNYLPLLRKNIRNMINDHYTVQWEARNEWWGNDQMFQFRLIRLKNNIQFPFIIQWHVCLYRRQKQ